ncbi:hypothetical protein KOW79_012931 [Hemibagrus wyckioides]|uniref:Uncharacterized protein n=1 Tax=Hemibagrus wyckioides TaxID=337641 RepID=A0A9D3NIZ4_9TELE|nr:hypothetical protein KOW79_012931 [Hemibagrus wyckioides]
MVKSEIVLPERKIRITRLFRGMETFAPISASARDVFSFSAVVENQLIKSGERFQETPGVVEPILQLLPTKPHNEPSAVILPLDADEPDSACLDLQCVSAVSSLSQPVDISIGMMRGPESRLCWFETAETHCLTHEFVEPNIQLLPTEEHQDPSPVFLPLDAGELISACRNIQFLSAEPSISQFKSVEIKTYFLGMIRGPQSRLCWFKTTKTSSLNHMGFPYESSIEDCFTGIQAESGRVTEFISLYYPCRNDELDPSSTAKLRQLDETPQCSKKRRASAAASTSHPSKKKATSRSDEHSRVEENSISKTVSMLSSEMAELKRLLHSLQPVTGDTPVKTTQDDENAQNQGAGEESLDSPYFSDLDVLSTSASDSLLLDHGETVDVAVQLSPQDVFTGHPATEGSSEGSVQSSGQVQRNSTFKMPAVQYRHRYATIDTRFHQHGAPQSQLHQRPRVTDDVRASRPPQRQLPGGPRQHPPTTTKGHIRKA